MTLVMPVDPIEYATNWLEGLKTRVTDIADYTIGGTQLAPGVTPEKHIRVMVVGNQDYHRVGDRVSLRFQVWRSGTEKARTAIANQLLAHARASLGGRKEAGPFSVPDQADPTKHLSQFEVSILLIGAQA